MSSPMRERRKNGTGGAVGSATVASAFGKYSSANKSSSNIPGPNSERMRRRLALRGRRGSVESISSDTEPSRSRFSLFATITKAIQSLLFWPGLGGFILASTVISVFFRSGQTFARTIVLCYTFWRLVIGFGLIIFWRVLRITVHYGFKFLEVFFDSKKHGNLRNQMQRAKTYDEWFEIASQLDVMNPELVEWMQQRQCMDYDWQLLDLQMTSMKDALSKTDENGNINIKAVQDSIVNVFRRTFCSLHNGHLYTNLYTGETKDIIEEYYSMLTRCLETIAHSNLPGSTISSFISSDSSSSSGDEINYTGAESMIRNRNDFASVLQSMKLGRSDIPISKATMTMDSQNIDNTHVINQTEMSEVVESVSSESTPEVSPAHPNAIENEQLSDPFTPPANSNRTDVPTAGGPEYDSGFMEGTSVASTAKSSKCDAITEEEDSDFSVNGAEEAAAALDASSADTTGTATTEIEDPSVVLQQRNEQSKRCSSASPLKMPVKVQSSKPKIDNIGINNNINDMSIADRLDFFYRCKRSLGRTALCLSGGGSLAMAHLGVVRELLMHNCLPKVISGASGGAIIAAVAGAWTDDELREKLRNDIIDKYKVKFLPNFLEQLNGAATKRYLMDTPDFINSMKAYVGDMTFQDAWLKTGRHLCIGVSYSTKNRKGETRNDRKNHAHHILLNHITAPDTLIWSAVTASCALPGLMVPQQLIAKGNVPYYPDGVEWVDGSIEADIPIKSLQELFRVNYCIVSQCNPHIAPFLLQKMDLVSQALGTSMNSNAENKSSTNSLMKYRSRISKVLEMLDDMANAGVNHQLNRLVKLKAIPAVYGQSVDNFVGQRFTGDITLVPRFPMSMRLKVLTQPTIADMTEYIRIGSKAVWPHLAHIRDTLRIEMLIDSCINKLRTDLYAYESALLVNQLSNPDPNANGALSDSNKDSSDKSNDEGIPSQIGIKSLNQVNNHRKLSPVKRGRSYDSSMNLYGIMNHQSNPSLNA